MAAELTIGSTGEKAKVRSPVAVALLTLVTIGIYGLVWYYKVNKELAAIGRDRGKSDVLGDSPGKSLLAVTLGACLIVPAIMSVIGTWKRIQAARSLAGLPGLSGGAGVVLALFTGPVFYAYEQSGLNAALQVLAVGPGAGATAIPAPAV